MVDFYSVIWISIVLVCLFVIYRKFKSVQNERDRFKREYSRVNSAYVSLKTSFKDEIKHLVKTLFDQRRKFLNDLSALRTDHQIEIDKWKSANSSLFKRLQRAQLDLDLQRDMIKSLTEKNTKSLKTILEQDSKISELEKQLEQFKTYIHDLPANN